MCDEAFKREKKTATVTAQNKENIGYTFDLGIINHISQYLKTEKKKKIQLDISFECTKCNIFHTYSLPSMGLSSLLLSICNRTPHSFKAFDTAPPSIIKKVYTFSFHRRLYKISKMKMKDGCSHYCSIITRITQRLNKHYMPKQGFAPAVTLTKNSEATCVHHLIWSCLYNGPGIYFGPDFASKLVPIGI